MAELHLLLIIDSENGKVRITDLSQAPVDSKGVWDEKKEVWRYPTDREFDMLLRAEGDITFALEKLVVAHEVD